jgi:hypothetical protein
LNDITDEALIPKVMAVLGEPLLDLGEWKSELLTTDIEIANRVVRLSGLAQTGNGARPWSLIHKTIRQKMNPDDHTLRSLSYPAREALAYRSGLLDNLPRGLAAPRCYAAEQDDQGIFYLWLEDLQDGIGKPWSLAHHGKVARCLGYANGVYLSGLPLPDYPWLSQGCVRMFTEQAAGCLNDLSVTARMPLFRRSFQGLGTDFLQEAWQRRGLFLDSLERLPQVFCHFDAWQANLFWRQAGEGQGQIVAIDWAFAGTGAVGEELAALVFMDVPENETPQQFYETCLEGYLKGLAEAGWQGDPAMVRFSSLTAIFYRYLFGVIFGMIWPGMINESTQTDLVASFGVADIETVADMLAGINAWFLWNYSEMSALLPGIQVF